MPVTLSLRFRIIALVAVLAVVLIAAFSILLINRQLRFTTEYNSYRARLGTLAAKGRLELVLLSSSRSAQDPAPAFQKMIPVLRESQLVDEIFVVDLSGRVVASGSYIRVGSLLPDSELQWVHYAKDGYSSKNWSMVQVNPQEIVFYTPLTLEEVPQYVAVFRYSLGNMAQAIQQVRRHCFLVALGVLAGIVPLTWLLMHTILDPIRTLNQATKDVIAGNINQKVIISTEDELGELADTFNSMTSTLARMKERAENANPLTRLPGNNMIQEQVETRIHEKTPFAVVYADLDNFKAFNDYYGIGVGDRAIKLTAQVLRQALKEGNTSDFLGHEGGDDFVLITTPDKIIEVTGFLGAEFDKRVQELYPAEDLSKGFIVSKDREGNVKEFPIMTISLAGVSSALRPLDSYAQVTNILAEAKKKAKVLSKSSGKSTFFMDRRSGSTSESPTPPIRSKQTG